MIDDPALIKEAENLAACHRCFLNVKEKLESLKKSLIENVKKNGSKVQIGNSVILENYVCKGKESKMFWKITYL